MGRKGDETRSFIKEKARILFEKQGFHRITMKDVCEVTGLSRGGLYGNYESTGQIFAAIMADLMMQQDDEFRTLQEEKMPAVDILNMILCRYREEMSDGAHSLSLAIYEYYSQFPKESANSLTIQYDNSKRMWEQLLQYGIETGEFHPVDAAAVYDLLVFSYQGVRMYSTITEIDPMIPERIISTMKAMVIRQPAN